MKEYTIKELCDYYGFTSMTLKRHRKNGLPFIRKGRRVYFILEDVEKWMNEKYETKKYNYDNKEKNLSN